MTNGWDESAAAWIADMGETGDFSRYAVLDPHLLTLLPEVTGWRVLDVGCGEGRYCRALRARGAHPVGLDPTEALVTHARNRDPEGEYHLGRAEALPFPDGSFDLVLNYLSLVDTPDFRSAIREHARVCRPGGQVLLVNIANFSSAIPTWICDAEGSRLHRAVDRYMDEFSVEVEWRGIRIQNYHRPLSALMTEFLGCGLILRSFTEPLPAPDSPHYEQFRRAPYFQVMLWEKPQ